MNATEILPYYKALGIYLEIYNHPNVIQEYIGRGLTEAEASSLASKISNDIANYEGAIGRYKGELYGGLALAIICLAVTIYILLYLNLDIEGKGLIRKIIILAIVGIGIFLKGLKDKKTVINYTEALKQYGFN